MSLHEIFSTLVAKKDPAPSYHFITPPRAYYDFTFFCPACEVSWVERAFSYAPKLYCANCECLLEVTKDIVRPSRLDCDK